MEAADEHVLARAGCMVVVAVQGVFVPSAAVEVGGLHAVGARHGEDGVAVERVANLGRMLVAAWVGGRAARRGVIVVAGEQVHMAAAVVEGCDGVGGEDGVDGRGRVEGHAVEGKAHGRHHADFCGRGARNRPLGHQERGRDATIHIFEQTFHAVVVVGGVDVGAGGGLAGGLAVGHADEAGRRIVELPGGVVVEGGEPGDEAPRDVVDHPVLNPDAACLGPVGDGAGAEGAHAVVGRRPLERDAEAGSRRARREGAALLGDRACEAVGEEEGAVHIAARSDAGRGARVGDGVFAAAAVCRGVVCDAGVALAGA